MTALYFAEKQLKRYPLRSLAYFLACFFFAVILVMFGTVTVSMQRTLDALAVENEMDHVVVSAYADGVTKEALASEKYVEHVEKDYMMESGIGRLRSQLLGETCTYGVNVFCYENGVPSRAVEIFENKYGRSPIVCGRNVASDGEIVLGERYLKSWGIYKDDYPKVIGATLVTSYRSYWTNEDTDDGEWTVVGVCDALFDDVLFGVTEYENIENYGWLMIARAPAEKPALGYRVYAEKGMLGSVSRSLAKKYGEDVVTEKRHSAEAQQEFSEYIAFFDRIFLFLLVLLCFAFLGVTVFAVVFYTSKQSEFHTVAAAFGARRWKLVLSQAVCYLALLLLAVLFSILVSALLQSAVFNVLNGYFSVVLFSVSVGGVFAVGGVLFAALALCVSAGVLFGTLAVKKRNL